MNNAIEIKELTKSYEDFKLNQINLTLPRGCIMGLIGENGAGKSTTIKSILNLIAVDSGHISVLGEETMNDGTAMTDNAKRTNEHIGVVLDECCFPENLTAKDINRIMANIFSTWDAESFQKYLLRFKLPEKKPIKQYSNGMKMKISIVVALSHDTNLLILDEATSGLDPLIREELLEVFMDFIQDESHSILISSHILSDLEKICDYITFIHRGEIVLSEQKDEMLESFGVIKCTEEALHDIDSSAIRGVRKNKFGVEALVLRDKVNPACMMDQASLEDIMLFHIKETRQ